MENFCEKFKDCNVTWSKTRPLTLYESLHWPQTYVYLEEDEEDEEDKECP